jgi:hypothetical protein
MMCENATHSRRMMEAIVQSGSAGISGPLGSVPKARPGGQLAQHLSHRRAEEFPSLTPFRSIERWQVD